ncbi:hypothetical protein AVEN_129345-1 [Araneus ventricosus]|uniref:Endonuclease/exonuclease/phosphatase domain-containing protein n=1 Tax=Araneus ventricosus TaxID=182803 RepID=A0A4Y2WEP0_ARAVE|nr:hypothetical protein AVEN_129345-1 [Araneus ventricosus]
MTQTAKGLVICYWNACGLTGKMLDFRTFVDEHKPDLILLQETKLKNNTKIYLPNYALYRNDGPQIHASGGTAIFIKNNISHKEISTPNLSVISATVLSVYLVNQPPITIASVYVPCRYDPCFVNDLKHILNTNSSAILCGDFNAHHRLWNCATINDRGKDLLNLSQSSNIEIIFPPPPLDLELTLPPLSTSPSQKTLPTPIISSPSLISHLITIQSLLDLI